MTQYELNLLIILINILVKALLQIFWCLIGSKDKACKIKTGMYVVLPDK